MRRYDNYTIQAKKTDEGFILDSPIVGRSGLLRYINADGSERWEYRPPEEAFKADSLASIRGKPITVGHIAMVNSDNSSRLPMVGTVLSEGKQDGDNIRVDVSIFNLPTNARELSCGYTLDLEETAGYTPDGKRYDAIQRNIRYNHLAIVEKGRAGNARLNMDGDQVVDTYNDDAELTTEEREKLPKSVFGLPEKRAYPMQDRQHAINAKARAKQQYEVGNLTKAEYDKIVAMADKLLNRKDDTMEKVRLDSGIEYDVVPEVKVEFEKIRKDNSDKQKSLDTLQGKFDALNSELETAKKEVEKAKEESKANFDSEVKARVEMLETAKTFKIDKAEEMSSKDIKIAIVKSVKGDSFNLDGKSDEYIEGVFDMCKVAKANTDESQAKVRTIINSPSEKKENVDALDYFALEQKLKEQEKTAYLGGAK